MELLEDFCSKASFHGLHFVGERNAPTLKRSFWLLTFVAGVAVFAYFAHGTVQDFLSRNTKIQIDESHAKLSEVTFPGVVVCNNNPFRRSFVYWIIKNLKGIGKLHADPIIKSGVKRRLTGEEQNQRTFF